MLFPLALSDINVSGLSIYILRQHLLLFHLFNEDKNKVNLEHSFSKWVKTNLASNNYEQTPREYDTLFVTP